MRFDGRGIGRLVSVLLLCVPQGADADSFFAHLTPEQVVPFEGEDSPIGTLNSGFVSLEFHPALTRLDYTIQLNGAELRDEIFGAGMCGFPCGVHIHFGLPGQEGSHTLNVYGFPSADDADLVLDPIQGTLAGSWDDGDENFGSNGVPDLADSKKFSQHINNLLAGRLYVKIHTADHPLGGELRGQIGPSPECFDGEDNDEDGRTDFPSDPQCDAIDDDLEACDASEDRDADGVADECDNCVDVYNPVLGTLGEPVREGFQTATGGQLDSDADGFGNHCDADFDNLGSVVGGVDLAALLVSFNRDRASHECGVSGSEACEAYDLDNLGQFIGGGDLSRAFEAFNLLPGPRCLRCPLECEGPGCP